MGFIPVSRSWLMMLPLVVFLALSGSATRLASVESCAKASMLITRIWIASDSAKLRSWWALEVYTVNSTRSWPYSVWKCARVAFRLCNTPSRMATEGTTMTNFLKP